MSIIGLVIGIIFLLIGSVFIFFTFSISSNHSNMIEQIKKEVRDVYNEVSFNSARNGDLIYVTGSYKFTGNAFDDEYNINFPNEPLIKRKTEMYQFKIFRMLDSKTPIKENEEVLNKKSNLLSCKISKN